MATSKHGHFSPELFKFLRELRLHNEREWFNANKPRFEKAVRDPFLAFIADIEPAMRKVSREIVVDPSPIGGSLFRIYRDTRFGHDKTPYKTHAAAHFRHAATRKDVHGPGFYLHLEPGGSFLAGGMWHPAPDALAKIRELIATKPKVWQAAIAKLPPLGGESLKRPPAGFDKEHPMIEDLKRKDFITSMPFKDAEVTSPAFAKEVVARCTKLAPLMKVLAKAVGFGW